MIFPASSPLLAIDTAGSACSVALWAERGILAHEIAATLHGHAVALAPMIERIAAGAGISLKSVSAVAVSCGPGGFTGMRVGLATARALALSIGCPAIGIDSFAVLAAAARRSTGPLEHGLLAVLDSRRAALVRCALVGLADDVLAQAQRDVTNACNGVRQRLDAGGIHRAHLLHDVEKAVQLGQHALAFVGAEFQPGEVRDAGDVGR